MTNENDSNDDVSSRADSGRSASSKQSATVLRRVPSKNPDTYLVEYPDGEITYEPATAKNRALFEDGLYDRINGRSKFVSDMTGEPKEVVLEADVENDYYSIEYHDMPVRVPKSEATQVIEAVQSNNSGSKLVELYHELTEGEVRRNAVEKFLGLFPDERVRVSDEGWVVDETFLVTWDGENHLLTVDPTSPSGDSYEDSKQGVYLDLNPHGEVVERAPDGSEVLLSEEEQVFLTTVEGLLFPEDYFEVKLVDEIQQKRAEASTKSLFSDLAEQSTVKGFTDSKTGIHHGSSNHSFQKHRLSDLDVTDETVEKLYYHDYDHTAVWEMLQRRQEFENAPFDVFEDAPNDDPNKWAKIERTSTKAPIPDWVREEMQEMFGETDD